MAFYIYDFDSYTLFSLIKEFPSWVSVWAKDIRVFPIYAFKAVFACLLIEVSSLSCYKRSSRSCLKYDYAFKNAFCALLMSLSLK